MLVLKASPSFMQRIAVVEVFGTIGGSVNSAGHERVFTAIEKDDKIRALVLDVDSPGGGVSASDYLYRSVARIAEKKPVVASIRGLGASGAYYISCAAQIIVASPAALVGSIGVLSVRPALRELLHKAGVRVSVNKSGHLKDMGRRLARRHSRGDREDAGDGGRVLRHVRFDRRQRAQPGR